MAKSKSEQWLDKDKLTLISSWARNGLTNKQIAHNMGINPSTLYDYMKKYKDISNALKKGKEVVDFEVENALLKRALGYEYKEITKESRYNEAMDKYEMIVTKEVTKHVSPDTTAQIYWLKNRKPKDWRDKIEIDTSKEELSKVDKLLRGIENNARTNK